MRDFKFFQKPKPLYWRTAMGQEIPISEMEGGHIYNVIGVLKKDGIVPNPYLGKTHDEWLTIFGDELKERYLR
jgi:hypothetical protein